MGEMAEYELGMLREDDIEDRIDELRRLLGESETQRKAAIAKLRTCRRLRRKLEAWVREALLKFTGTRIAVVFTDDRCAECYFCHGSVPRSAKESIPHTADCIIARGEKLLLEGADGG